nr:MAG TPA: hypothetical protein [Caudoviricetes sp.]
MKYKYLKGNAVDFDGAPDWATLRTFTGGCAFFAESHSVGARVYDIARKYEFTVSDDGVDEEEINVIAHREPMNITEVGAEMRFAQEIQNTAQDVSKLIDKEIKASLTTATEALITERGSRYGKFKDGADIMQSLKDTMRDVDGWNNLTASQKEALDMIQHKIGRILNGDPTYDDSWKDIAGYATLIVNELNGEVK